MSSARDLTRLAAVPELEVAASPSHAARRERDSYKEAGAAQHPLRLAEYPADAPPPSPEKTPQTFRVAFINALEADARIELASTLGVGKACAGYINTRAPFPKCAEIWPGLKLLAGDARVSPRTVRRALAELERLGYIYPRPPWEERRKKGWKGQRPLTLHLRIPNITPRPELRLPVFQAIEGGDGRRVENPVENPVENGEPDPETMAIVSRTMATVAETMAMVANEAPVEAREEALGGRAPQLTELRASAYIETCVSCREAFETSDPDEAFCSSCVQPAWRN